MGVTAVLRACSAARPGGRSEGSRPAGTGEAGAGGGPPERCIVEMGRGAVAGAIRPVEAEAIMFGED